MTSENDIGVTVHSTQPSLWYFNTDRAGNTAATELTGLINDSPLTELNTRDRAFAQALCQLATERLVDTAVTTSQPPN